MKQLFIFLILLSNTLLLKSQTKVDLCDSLDWPFSSKYSCYSKGKNVYTCGVILTQRIISPALYYSYYKSVKNRMITEVESSYFPNNINFINNLEFKLISGYIELIFTTKNKMQKKWKFKLSKKLNFEKKLRQIEESLKAEILQFED